MTDFTRERTIKYLNRDFEGFKRDLLKFSEAHHSGVFSDTNEASPGMALLEMAAFVGDSLSYYLDQSFNELKQETAKQEKNVVSFAKSLGYRPRGKRAARGSLAFILELPATLGGRGETIPDESFAPVMRARARVEGPNGTSFETLDPVDFSASLGREVTGSRFDATTGIPTHFAVRKFVDIVAGETKTQSTTITDFEQFKTIELNDADVIEVLSVVDSDGNEWHEVDFLAQDTVFDYDSNSAADADDVPYTLKLITVPRRFVTDTDPTTRKTKLVFGAGNGVRFDDELVPDFSNLALPLPGRGTFTTYPLDPQNFLKTRDLGLSPFNTTLTITYRVGGGSETNVPRGSIRNIADAIMDFRSTTLNSTKKGDVESSLQCVNLEDTDGGGPPETLSEIKANSSAHFATQLRLVTRDDYITRVLTLPEKFGKVSKVFVKKNPANPMSLDLHVLTEDANGHLATASSTLKSNIKQYLKQFRMITDGVNILDGNIVNLRCNFGIVVSKKFNRSEVLTKCLSVAMNYLDMAYAQIGQPIIISDLSAELQSVLGVVSVYELRFSNVFGLTDSLDYSLTRFDVRNATRNNIIYCPEGSIFEIKHPRVDIIGVSK